MLRAFYSRCCVCLALGSLAFCGLALCNLALSRPAHAQETTAPAADVQTEPPQSQNDAAQPQSSEAQADSQQTNAQSSDTEQPDAEKPDSEKPDAGQASAERGDNEQPSQLTSPDDSQPSPMPLTTPEAIAKQTAAAASNASSGDQASDTASEPTEEERQARLQDLLSLVQDNTLGITKRENPAYFALVKEVLTHSPEELRSKARVNPRFDEFYRNASKHRGELVQLALNVRRVLPIDIRFENQAGASKLYEIWGWTDEAKAWMYCCITPELPPGFPGEGDVAERVELTGYFFKMQAYQPGDAAPNARNLVAPLVIGRITSAPKPAGEAAEGFGNWPLFLVGGFGVIIFIRLLMQMRLFWRPASTQRHYRRRSLEPLDADSLGDSLGSTDRGLPIRNSDE